MKWVVRMVVCVVAVCLLQACSDQEETLVGDNGVVSTGQGSKQGGIYRIPLQNSPSTLDPAYVQDGYGVYVTQQIFEGLVAFDRQLMVVPALATSWRVEEQGRVYRFFLDPEARFHDDSPVRASDVVYSLERLVRVSPPSVLLPHLLKVVGAEDFREGRAEQVSGLIAEDDTTVVVRLVEPHTPFLTALGMYQAKIVPREVVSTLGGRFGQEPVGSGPFAFVEWVRNDLIRLRRFAGFTGTPALLDEVHYRIYPGGEVGTILEDFQAGMLEEMPVYGSIKEKLEGMPGLQLLHRPSLSLLFYGMRVDTPPLDHPGLRKALSLAVDRQALVQEVYSGMFEPAATVLPPGMPGYTPPGEPQQGRAEQARKLVSRIKEELGTLPPLEIVSATKSAFSQAELAFVRRSWEQAGVEVRERYITDWSEFEDYLRSDAVQIFRYVWTADMPDPDNFMTPLFASDSSINFMHFHDSGLDTALARARGLTDPVERAQMYARIESVVLEQHPVLPLFYLSADRAFQPWVRGAFLTPLGWQDLRLAGVWIE